MFAESGAAPPPGLGTGTPQQVGNAVVRAIEHDKTEISVAPVRQRALARFAMLASEISGRLAGSVTRKAADAIAAGQTESDSSRVRLRLSPDAFRASTGRVDRLVSPGHGHDRT